MSSKKVLGWVVLCWVGCHPFSTKFLRRVAASKPQALGMVANAILQLNKYSLKARIQALGLVLAPHCHSCEGGNPGFGITSYATLSFQRRCLVPKMRLLRRSPLRGKLLAMTGNAPLCHCEWFGESRGNLNRHYWTFQQARSWASMLLYVLIKTSLIPIVIIRK